MSDWQASFHAAHPSHATMQEMSAEIADGLQPETAAAPAPALAQLGGKGKAKKDGRTYEARCKADLYKLACKRDIKGRASMSKDELIAALRK